jgi:hypothetical protein
MRTAAQLDHRSRSAKLHVETRSMNVDDEASETLVICPACMKSDGRRGDDPNCKTCQGSGMVSSDRAAKLRLGFAANQPE